MPAASLLLESDGPDPTRNVAMRSSEGDALIVYLAASMAVKLRLDAITSGDRLTARWTNPATGEEPPGVVIDRQAHSFAPPADWADALLHVYAQHQDAR